MVLQKLLTLSGFFPFFPHLVPVCFPDTDPVLTVCFPENDDVSGSGDSLIKQFAQIHCFWESGEIPWGCHSGMNLVKSWEDEL